ncbi:MAG: RHS repeat domain-containing protein, partial [Bacteroidia bacterium]
NQQDIVSEKLVPPPTVIHYDPLQRNIRKDDPKGFFTKVEFTPWEEWHYDENDTLKDSDYYLKNYTTTLSSEERDALDKALKSYNTPNRKIQDNLGSLIRSIENNLGEVFPDHFSTAIGSSAISVSDVWNELVAKGYLVRSINSTGAWPTAKFQPYKIGFAFTLDVRFNTIKQAILDVLRQSCLTSFYKHDIEGRLIHSTDARLFYLNVSTNASNYNFKYVYALGSTQPFFSDSVDAGTEYHFDNIFGSLIWSWTARNFNQTIQYDRFQRRVSLRVKGYKDDGSLASDNVAEQFSYGESQANAELNNLRGQVFQINDLSGTYIQSKYNLNGQVVATSRQYARDYKNTLNWAAPVAMNTDLFTKSFEYDALNRLVSERTPDNSVTKNTYDKTGLLQTISVKHPTAPNQIIISKIEYNAQHLRTKVNYGNNTQSTYSYEPTTWHLMQLKATRVINGVFSVIQDLSYVYDPVGNITRLADHSFKTIFSNNQQVDAVSDYTYDALYRLTKANGRQHPSLTLGSSLNNKKDKDFKQSQFFASINDNTKLENYTERY